MGGWGEKCAVFGVVGCAFCLGITLSALVVGIGAWLIWLGKTHQGVTCEGPLATWATVQGSLLVATFLAGILGFILVSTGLWSRKSEKFESKSLGSLTASVLTPIVQLVGIGGGLSIFGVFVWGTVLAFRNDQWNRMRAASSDYPCDPSLYFPSALYLIVVWSILPAFLALGCICLCCCAPLMMSIIGFSELSARKENKDEHKKGKAEDTPFLSKPRANDSSDDEGKGKAPKADESNAGGSATRRKQAPTPTATASQMPDAPSGLSAEKASSPLPA